MTDYAPDSMYAPDSVEVNGEIFEVYLTREELAGRVREMGETLTREYEGKNPIFVGVLNGAFIFLSDLMRQVKIPCEVDFMKVSSYGSGKASSGEIRERKGIDAEVRGRHVILVEDIIDTGLSMKHIIGKLRRREPASIAVVTLLHKAEVTREDVEPDHVGFRIPNRFVVGYGLDYAQEGRNLSQVYVLREDD